MDKGKEFNSRLDKLLASAKDEEIHYELADKYVASLKQIYSEKGKTAIFNSVLHSAYNKKEKRLNEEFIKNYKIFPLYNKLIKLNTDNNENAMELYKTNRNMSKWHRANSILGFGAISSSIAAGLSLYYSSWIGANYSLEAIRLALTLCLGYLVSKSVRETYLNAYESKLKQLSPQNI